ncbi:hypothetical protein [Citrobacter freundii]
MNSHALLKNSSVFIAYMGCLGWGSAYFYGWGVSFYYGFPWWIVCVGTDDIARSLFYAVVVMFVFIVGWGTGIAFFFAVKQKDNMRDLNVLRLFFAIILLFIPVVVEISILKKDFQYNLLVFSFVASMVLTIVIRFYGAFFSLSSINQRIFIMKYCIELVMVFFVIYFWLFSFLSGYYKPQFKKEYEMISFKNDWYYVLARFDNQLVLSKYFKGGNGRFLVFRSEQSGSYEVNIVRTRL